MVWRASACTPALHFTSEVQFSRDGVIWVISIPLYGLFLFCLFCSVLSTDGGGGSGLFGDDDDDADIFTVKSKKSSTAGAEADPPAASPSTKQKMVH